MSKNNLKSLKIAAVALFAFIVLFAGSVAWGQTNPVSGSIPVSVRVSIGPLVDDFEIYVPCQAYDSTKLPWNGVNTTANRPITNFLTSNLTFPIKPSVTGLTYDITAEHVNARFDPLHPKSAGWTKIGNPSMMSNCHGYSTGRGRWLNEFPKMMHDDYVPL